ncbi:MAG: response regulator transcription factor [Cyanobacteria bacterium K_DeepCast_35m_m2_023]|nr:response regulator transcription factor [Cyanobacteria bacterium K_DeepCast_35m_m2_023]
MRSSSVLLVDDHRMVAQAVGGLLSQFCNLDRLELCASVVEAIDCIERHPPDLLILDLHLPEERWQDAADALQQHSPAGQLIILSAVASGFALPVAYQKQLLAVIDKALACDELLAVVERWQQRRQGPRCDALQMHRLVERLCPREQRVFEALGKGLLNREIAVELGLNVSTVDTYRKAISSQLGQSGAELVRAAVLHRCLPKA